MLIVKSHKVMLKTKPEIEHKFYQFCGVARWAYNWCLEQKINAYKNKEKSPSTFDLMKQMVVLKKTDEYNWLADYPCDMPRTAARQIDTAYANFFRRVKKGEAKKGFPKFKSKKRSKLSFHLESEHITVKDTKFRVPKVGIITLHQPLRFEGRIVGTVCISCTAGKWYASFAIETSVPDQTDSQGIKMVGVDLGITKLATLSDGKEFDNPKATARLEALLARAQRIYAKKQPHSNRKKRTLLRIQRIHKRIGDYRAQYTHLASSYIAKKYNVVCIEDLNVKGMISNRHLAKSICDANFAELRRQLEYKTGWNGGKVIVIDRFFPSSKLCSVCGTINQQLKLSDRNWICACGAHHSRDLNAAINILGRGWTVSGRGGQGAVIPSYEASTTPVISEPTTISDIFGPIGQAGAHH